EHLRESGDLDETIVLWIADHGELLGDFGCFGKRSILDAAANIPLIVRYPERFEAGAVCDRVCSNVDVAPTLLGACGLETIEQHQGHDLADIAAGGTADRPGVLCQYSQRESGLYGLVTDELKYVYSAADDQEWLFRRWPGEAEGRSLAGNQAYLQTTAEMRSALIEWFRRDGYTEVLDGEGWRAYPAQERPTVDDNPDHGLLYQEGRDWREMFPEGYGPVSTPHGG
ncbi:MAG: sulfatase family protein, partial [Armatimonadota bacterium]